MAAKQAGGQSAQQLISRRVSERVLRYLLALPDQGSDEPLLPFLLFLHGAGERGEDVSAVKRHGPPKLIAAGVNLPFLVASPQCPANRWWIEFDMLELLDELMEELVSLYPVDKERIYVTGISMGGFGAWRLAIDHPERFAAVVPICGGGEPEYAHRLIHLPIWAFHGERDAIVPLEYSVRMVEAIRHAGGENVKLTTYPNVGHDCWTVTYENPEVYQWLLQHRRHDQ